MEFPLLALVVCLLIAFFIGSVIFRKMNGPEKSDQPMKLPAMISWSLLIVTIAFNIFVYDRGIGIGYGLFGAAMMVAIFLTFPKEKRTREAWFFVVVGTASALLLGFRANEFVQIVNVVCTVICATTLVLLRSLETVRWHVLWLTKMKLGFLGQLVHQPFAIGSSMRAKKNASGSMLFTVIKTIAITLIVLLFFSALLSSADPVFDSLIREFRDQAFGRTITTGLLVAVLLFGLSITIPSKWQKSLPKFTFLGFPELFIPALSLILLFGLFLFVQAKYLFATHEDFQVLNITYSEYVRKGFIELLVASFFGSVLSYVLILKHHAVTDRVQALRLKLVNGVLLVELLLLLASAAKRDWMYIETYGLTRVRFIGGIFLLWLLGVIILIFALNALKRMQEGHFLRSSAVLSAVVLLALNVINIDNGVALSTPPRNQPLDIVYITMLSSDTVDGWMAAIDDASKRYEVLRTKQTFTDEERVSLAETKIAMSYMAERLPAFYDEHAWQEWNWSKDHAEETLQQTSFSPISRAVCIKEGIRQLQRNVGLDLSEEEWKRLYDYSSPFTFGPRMYPSDLDWTAERVTATVPSCM